MSDDGGLIEKSSCSGSDPFALQVLGDSMLPEFKEGDIIVIEPDGVIKDGSFVFATHDGEYIFRQLKMDGDKYYLVALNDAYPILEIPGLEAVHGVIVSGGGTRRRDRKSYV